MLVVGMEWGVCDCLVFEVIMIDVDWVYRMCSFWFFECVSGIMKRFFGFWVDWRGLICCLLWGRIDLFYLVIDSKMVRMELFFICLICNIFCFIF